MDTRNRGRHARGLSRRGVAMLLALGLAGLPLAGAMAGAETPWRPDGPVTLIVPWSAGGGTDATARLIARRLTSDLGVPVPVVNRTGGSGVIGHAAIADAAPDGRTIGIATLEIGTMHAMGLTDLDHTAYTPIGLYNADPAALFVRADSAHGTAADLLDALDAAPDRALKASGSTQGGVYHLALAGMLRAAGLPVARVAWCRPRAPRPAFRNWPPAAWTSPWPRCPRRRR
ncbi:tripartite tricarboxylate transporter substrate-binding protein [Roseospira navarrensis]|uniref:tripartite tricarboxylate transporter substrate-binding protein n=1 Tax=Roseospira navarrensis TaxID=140058 RepID=UPI001B864D38|nr:tripartite tricarboxylate transporter substrate-binding protein [Roseospira navarrensis]